MRSSQTCLHLQINDNEQRVSLGGSALPDLMQEELTVLGPDGAFDAAFEQAENLVAR